MNYSKPALSVDDLVDRLEARGMIIPDKNRSIHYLSHISYYRLSAYMFPFRLPDGSENFKKDVTFDLVLDHYIFDRELRILAFDAIERIEIAIRTQIIQQFSTTHGPHFFEEPSLFRNNKFLMNNLEKLDEEIKRSNETFIKHYFKTYTNPLRPPAWMSIEVASLGLLSKFYSNFISCKEKKLVAAHFGTGNHLVFESWMHSITALRNTIAHHSRMWNKTFTIKPKIPKKTKYEWVTDKNYPNNKLYSLLVTLMYLKKVINPKTNFAIRLKELIEKYPIININSMGFPKDWQNDKFWCL